MSLADGGNADGGHARRANRLSLTDQMAAVRWLQANSDYALKTPQGKVAASLSTILERPVTVGNLGTLAKAAGVCLHGMADAQLTEMSARMANLEKRLNQALPALEQYGRRLAALESGGRIEGKEVAP